MSDPVTRFIESDSARLPADLVAPEGARAIVVFAHGTGSSRLSTRNRAVAEALRADGTFGTLLFDLLSPEEDRTYQNRFEIALLTARLLSAAEWLDRQPETRGLPLGLFGASTGAAAALSAAPVLGDKVKAVVSRGGRPDLAMRALPLVGVPTLLIVGGQDTRVIEFNEQALAQLSRAPGSMVIVPGATHLFEEPGTLDQVVTLTRDFFEQYL